MTGIQEEVYETIRNFVIPMEYHYEDWLSRSCLLTMEQTAWFYKNLGMRDWNVGYTPNALLICSILHVFLKHPCVMWEVVKDMIVIVATMTCSNGCSIMRQYEVMHCNQVYSISIASDFFSFLHCVTLFKRF